MKKMYLLLAVVLIAFSAFAVAEETDAVETTVATADTITTATPALISANVVKMPVKKLHLVGHGLVINTADPMEFMSAQVAAGIVRVRNSRSVEEISLGVLTLDDNKYRLKNVMLEDGKLTADIYDNTGENQVGDFTLNKYERPGRNVWAGSLTLSDAEYNAYFLGIARTLKPVEVAQKVGEYCGENSDNVLCKKVVDCGNAEECKARVSDFCENNSEDAKCKALQKEYCLRNSQDSRCEEYLKGLCEANPQLAHCRIRTVNGKQIM
ncbi:MAG: hypothetical protein V1672_02755 [Candidatus Diapherotrites archaeon]